MNKSSRLSWYLILFVGMVTLGALAWLTLLALDKEYRDVLATLEQQNEDDKNTALLRIDSKLSSFVNIENERRYEDYAKSTAEPSIPYNKDFVNLYFQIKHDGSFEVPKALSDGLNLSLVQRYLKLFNKFKEEQQAFSVVDEAQKKTGFKKLDREHETEREEKVGKVKQELSIEEIAVNNERWLSKVKEVVDQQRNNKVLAKDSSINVRSNKLERSISNLNTRVEIAQSAYKKKGRGIYRQRMSDKERADEQKLNDKKQNPSRKLGLRSLRSTAKTIDQKRDEIDYEQEYDARRDSSLGRSILVTEGVLKPVWYKGELILVRVIALGKEVVYQLILIDLNRLNHWVGFFIDDLLPHAEILSKIPNSYSYKTRLEQGLEQLALLPVLLNPRIQNEEIVWLRWTPMMASVVTVWICIFLLTFVIIILIRRTLSLSERRGAFASAVTHELRTPLSTFKMYTELLDEGMIQSEEKKKQYYGILRSESERLGSLVENVLSYSRIEKSNKHFSKNEVTIEELSKEITSRSIERVQKSGFVLIVRVPDSIKKRKIMTDAQAVEQIIFNLVENACKYASVEGGEGILFFGVNHKKLEITLSDNGPGVREEHRKKLFQPFFKSDRDAANTSQGVGLGLALSRKMARQLGGDLKLNKTRKGASFTLTLNNLFAL